MTTETFDDLANAEVDAVQKRIDSLQSKDKKIKKQIQSLYTERERLEGQIDRARDSLSKAKKQSAKLKKLVWTSDNPNLVDLRNQILLAAKLIQDDQITKKGKK